MTVLKKDVLKLYRDLLRYKNQLQLTDKTYYSARIRKEFEANKNILKKEEVKFHYEGLDIFGKQASSVIMWLLEKIINSFALQTRSQLYYLMYARLQPVNRCFVINAPCYKHTIDYSLVPKLNEEDLEEQFVRGSGPGGSNVNKNSNCVLLIHKPTGIVVKCHLARLLEKNRKMARDMMISKLDQHVNKERSVVSQTQLLIEKKSAKKENRRKKLMLMKETWKEREGIS